MHMGYYRYGMLQNYSKKINGLKFAKNYIIDKISTLTKKTKRDNEYFYKKNILYILSNPV